MPEDTFSQVLSWGIPALLLIIAVGFIYVKFIGPYVVPLLKRLIDWGKGQQEENTAQKELTFE